MRAFPPRLPEQPIFYPVLSEDYAVKIARDWNVPACGSRLRHALSGATQFLERYQVHEAGGQKHREYWIPAEELSAFNAALVGEIEVIATFHARRRTRADDDATAPVHVVARSAPAPRRPTRRGRFLRQVVAGDRDHPVLIGPGEERRMLQRAFRRERPLPSPCSTMVGTVIRGLRGEALLDRLQRGIARRRSRSGGGRTGSPPRRNPDCRTRRRCARRSRRRTASSATTAATAACRARGGWPSIRRGRARCGNSTGTKAGAPARAPPALPTPAMSWML